MSCLIEKKNSELGPRLGRICVNLITQVESIAFSDYRLIGKFVERCEEDIEKRKCGRVLAAEDRSYLSQGKVLACLEKDVESLREGCKKQARQSFTQPGGWSSLPAFPSF